MGEDASRIRTKPGIFARLRSFAFYADFGIMPTSLCQPARTAVIAVARSA
jgi:hypothetical protein